MTSSNLHILPIAEHTTQALQLVDTVFGYGRYAKTAERLREGAQLLSCSVIAFDAHARAAATVLLYALQHHDMLRPAAQVCAQHPLILLGPMAVLPQYQQQGVGHICLQHTLRNTQETFCHGTILLVGHTAYYQRFGFSTTVAQGFHWPTPINMARCMGLTW